METIAHPEVLNKLEYCKCGKSTDKAIYYCANKSCLDSELFTFGECCNDSHEHKTYRLDKFVKTEEIAWKKE